ncbi:hypothetical protein NDU88_007998 [Pleurodeles waltl]|uniref:CCHC-type domain-containing protein n=1 Tax=Pleurodeles waltl TaxID=8319 RepID=A0AAV7PQV4_PLEWA|nr:hypothetical protein NDU88_007998 [Pleurodeles waltl]
MINGSLRVYWVFSFDFMCSLGTALDCQEIFENLSDPGEEATDLIEFEMCLRKLDLHFLPKISTILERFHFGMREQRPGESIEGYITALRKLASTCKFGITIEERIRNQFMLRCASDKIRQELWSKDDPTLQEVIVLVKSVEHTMACVDELEKEKKVDVNKISTKKELTAPKGYSIEREDEKVDQGVVNRYKDARCFRCGNIGHYASYKKIPALNSTCRLCNKKGHFGKCCRSQRSQTSVKVVEDCNLPVSMGTGKKKHPKDIVTILGVSNKMLFDSGAWLTLISNKVFDEQLSHKVELKDPDIVQGGYEGQVIYLRGYFEAEIGFQTNTICGKVYVPV